MFFFREPFFFPLSLSLSLSLSLFCSCFVALFVFVFGFGDELPEAKRCQRREVVHRAPVCVRVCVCMCVCERERERVWGGREMCIHSCVYMVQVYESVHVCVLACVRVHMHGVYVYVCVCVCVCLCVCFEYNMFTPTPTRSIPHFLRTQNVSHMTQNGELFHGSDEDEGM